MLPIGYEWLEDKEDHVLVWRVVAYARTNNGPKEVIEFVEKRWLLPASIKQG